MPHHVINGIERSRVNMHLRNNDLIRLVADRSIAFSVLEVRSETIAVVTEMGMKIEGQLKKQLDIIISKESERILNRLQKDIVEMMNTLSNIR